MANKNETVQELLDALDESVDKFFRDYEKVKKELHKQEKNTTKMIKEYASPEIDRKVWVCEECKSKCLTSYRANSPRFCPNCGKKVKND